MHNFMKNFTLTFLILFNVLSVQGQIEVKYYFKSKCENVINKDSITFELQNVETLESFYSEDSKVTLPSSGKYELFVNINNGKFQKSFEEKFDYSNSQKVIDTIEIPKILFETTPNLNDDNYWNYSICNILCNGYITDYFSNGKKRIEGDFINGKSKWVSEYEKDGSYTKYFYKSDFSKYEKVENFDSNGNLKDYCIFKYEKKYWYEKVYNANGKFLKRIKRKYYPRK